MKGILPNPEASHHRKCAGVSPGVLLRFGICSLLAFMLFGCSALQGARPTASGSIQTEIALEVMRIAATSAARSPAVQPTSAAQPTAAEQPTYTPLPTYTPYPTYTPVPSFTPFASPIPLQTSIVPTQTPLSPAGGAHPYTLRVRNMFRSTYWIGTYQPYGGNFIKPYWYVEFYPPRPTEMRIFFCRYSSYFFNHWQDIDFSYDYQDLDTSNNWNGCRNWGYFNYWWDHDGLYNCNYLDFMVDKPLVEVQVP